jgi:hypothetical protein
MTGGTRPGRVEGSATPLLESMRRQIEERIRLQQQLLGVAVAVAAAELSFFADSASGSSLVPAMFSLLFIGFALAILRNDQEITVLASHILSPDEFGEHAYAQARWENHKFRAMQRSGVANFVTTAAQVVGIYGLPTLAGISSFVASVAEGPNAATWIVLAITTAFGALFVGAAMDVRERYQRLGVESERLLERSGGAAGRSATVSGEVLES